MYNSTENSQSISLETSKGLAGEVSLKLTKLRKYTKYIMSVLAFNRMGKGPFSPEIIGSTDEDGEWLTFVLPYHTQRSLCLFTECNPNVIQFSSKN